MIEDRLTKSKLERWLRSYRRFMMGSCLWCPAVALLCFVGLAVAPRNPMGARILTALLGTAVGSLFVITGAYFAVLGLSLYCRRIRTTTAGALFGLSVGLLAGAFTAYLGAVAFWMMWR